MLDNIGSISIEQSMQIVFKPVGGLLAQLLAFKSFDYGDGGKRENKVAATVANDVGKHIALTM